MAQDTSAGSIDVFKLVFHVDVFLLACTACVVLAGLPRLLVRFTRIIEWRQGHILRYVTLDPRKRRAPPIQQAASTSTVFNEHATELASEESHTNYSHTHLLQAPRAPLSKGKLPPHLRSWTAIFPSAAALLRYRLEAGFSVGQLLVLVVYLSALVYATLLESDPFTDPKRTGYVAMAQIPFVYALATKNNLLSFFIGYGYEKLNYIHRFAGRLIVLASNIHALGYVYQWTLDGTFAKNARQPSNIWGFVALACLDILYLFSTSFWRQKAYNIFFSSHVVGFLLFLPAAYEHQASMLNYIVAAACFLGFDHICRLIKTRLCYARIRPMPDLTMTRLEIPELNAGWRPGQHVRLRIVSSAMGWWGWAEVHPFTIASVGKTEEGLVLMCKKTGRWTSRLYEMAKMAGYGEGGLRYSRRVKVMVEGPYGGPGHAVFASFSAAMFVVGGSGITFGLSALQDLIQRDVEGASRMKVIELIWSVQDQSALTPLIPLFAALIQQSIHTPLKISVHYTGAATVPEISKEFLPPGLTLSPGRPRVAKVLDAVISRTTSFGSGVKASLDLTGVIIGVCGPIGLADDVAQIISQVDASRRWAVGGIELHEETFSW